MSKTFKRNILVGFGLSILLLLLSSIASYISIKSLLASSEAVDHTHSVITKLENLTSASLQAESNQRGYLITGNDVFLETMQVNLAEIREYVDDLEALTADNPAQRANLMELSKVLEARLSILRKATEMRKQNLLIENDWLLKGKAFMDEVKALIHKMESEENRLLGIRTQKLKTFSNYTPVLIVLASVISLLITIVFYGRVVSDFDRRAKLQEALTRKDVETSRRLGLIQGIAEKVARGDYSVRVDDEGADLLGSLGHSLNRMSDSLQKSFTELSEKEWLQTRVAVLATDMVGEQEPELLAGNIVSSVVESSGSVVGALYLYNEFSGQLLLRGRYGLHASCPESVAIGEGVAGEAAKQKKIIEVTGLSDNSFALGTASGLVYPNEVVAIPILFENDLKGVLELGSISGYDNNHREFFRLISGQAGVALNTAENRRRLQELLEETQAQTEELQSQHSELENINEELKAQSQRLQVSEEELRVQQEELMQTNVELEERTTLLEEKNQMIEERNQEIQQKARELALSTKYKSEFLANMSHELRTPLNSILLLSRLMLENNNANLSSDQLEYASVIHNSGQGLLSLIDEILDLSKIEAGKMEVEVREVAVKEITNDVRSLFAPMAKQKQLAFNIHISPEVPETLQTDRMRLEQILKNLISNAIKFTAEGSVELHVSKHPKHANTAVFAVRDTGIGIATDKQQLVFEAFQQADGSTRRQYGGTGLGLSISRELARLLGGHIELSSEPGKGSEFRLVVPVVTPEHVPVANAAEELLNEIQPVSEAVNSERLATGSSTGVLVTENDTTDKMSQVFHRIEDVLKKEPCKVLIVEENPVHARALAYFLENFNINAMIRHEVEEARDALLKNDPACVILDMGIQSDATYKALEQVKKTEGLEYLPIIVFTGKSLSQMQEGRLKQYVNSIVIKTAHSYQRILDEVSIFLHLQQERKDVLPASGMRKLGRLTEVLKGKKVLVADDDVRNIFSLSKVLENYGMDVLSAIDGREALEQIKKHPEVDVVLMDMMMPELDGYETMTRIRSMQGFSKLPIIAVTAKAMAGDREKCIRSGASDYITKPIDKDQLLSLLRVWLYDRI